MKFTIIEHEELDSTSLEGKRLLADGKVSEPTVVVAKRQSGGRGSRGRAWISPAGNVYATYIFRFDRRLADLPLLVYPISLAIMDCIKNFSKPEKVEIKWPNDILIDGRKVSGSLHETQHQRGSLFFLAGIGINVQSSPSEDLRFTACHLNEFSSKAYTSGEVIEVLSLSMTERIQSWKEDNTQDFLKEFTENAYGLGKMINVSTRGDRSDTVTGIFKGIDEDGQLHLDVDGRIVKFSTGSIFPDLDRAI